MSVFGFNYDSAYEDMGKQGLTPGDYSLERLSFDQLRMKLKHMGLNFNAYMPESAKSSAQGSTHSTWGNLMSEIEREEESAREEAVENATYYSLFLPSETYAARVSYENTYEKYSEASF